MHLDSFTHALQCTYSATTTTAHAQRFLSHADVSQLGYCMRLQSKQTQCHTNQRIVRNVSDFLFKRPAGAVCSEQCLSEAWRQRNKKKNKFVNNSECQLDDKFLNYALICVDFRMQAPLYLPHNAHSTFSSNEVTTCMRALCGCHLKCNCVRPSCSLVFFQINLGLLSQRGM